MELQDLISQKNLIDQLLETPRRNESTHIFFYPRKQTEKLSRRKKTHRNREDAGARANNITFIKKKKTEKIETGCDGNLLGSRSNSSKKKSSFGSFGGQMERK